MARSDGGFTSGTTTQYFYLGGAVMGERQGAVWRDYLYFGGQRVAWMVDATDGALMHTDHLGSVRVCTFGSNVIGTCEYEPFGETQAGSSCSLPTNYRFAGPALSERSESNGMEFDPETGLYHTWFRQYDEKQGRWTSVDPLPGSADSPQSLNRYAYVLNDPVNLVDPLGLTHCSCDEATGSCICFFPRLRGCWDVYIDGTPAVNTCALLGRDWPPLDRELQWAILEEALRKALQNLNCAALLGSEKDVKKLLKQLRSIIDVSRSGWSPATSNQRRIDAEINSGDVIAVSEATFLPPPGFSLGARVWTGEPFNIYVGSTFNSFSPGAQLTILIHELWHVARPENFALDFAPLGGWPWSLSSIAKACGTEIPPLPQR